jgi:hypothetical protein
MNPVPGGKSVGERLDLDPAVPMSRDMGDVPPTPTCEGHRGTRAAPIYEVFFYGQVGPDDRR